MLSFRIYIYDPVEKPSLAEFVGSSSKFIFNLIGLDKEKFECMKLPPQYWSKMSGFNKFQEFVKKFPVTNDSAVQRICTRVSPRVETGPATCS